MQQIKQNKGSVSVYLIMIFGISLSLLLLLIEGARGNAMRLKTECAMDLSMFSVFAEYNRELLEQYDLFFIDTSYGQKGAGPNRTEDHLKGYMNENFKTSSGVGLIKDMLALQTDSVTITDFSLASDEGGELLKKQAVAYMKNLYGISYLSELQNQLNTVHENQLLTRDIEGERQANQSIIDNYKLPKKKVSADKWEDVKLDNPADAVNASRGILTFILPQDTAISNAGINPDNYISKRNCNVGSGLSGRKATASTDELIFNEYILRKAGNYTQLKENSELQYELEYVLKGHDSDLQNLKAIVTQMLLLRETSNYIFLCTDAARNGEAETLAAAVALAVFCPDLEEPIKQTILFAWAYAESVYDVRMLLAGGKIPLMKTSETWHYSLLGMLHFATDNVHSDELSENGMSYLDYMRVFLALENEQNKTNRFMDIVEMDIRRTDGNGYFRLDTCMDYIEAEAHISGKYGANYQIKRSFYYEK